MTDANSLNPELYDRLLSVWHILAASASTGRWVQET